MRRMVFGVALAAMLFAVAPEAHAFCGFYVGKAGAKLFNKASQVVLVRDGDRTVMTMASDFKGEMKEFAIVIPVPTFLKKEQIHVGDKKLVRERSTEYYLARRTINMRIKPFTLPSMLMPEPPPSMAEPEPPVVGATSPGTPVTVVDWRLTDVRPEFDTQLDPGERPMKVHARLAYFYEYRIPFANWVITHSALFGDQMPTRSPLRTPAPSSARAHRSTWSCRSA